MKTPGPRIFYDTYTDQHLYLQRSPLKSVRLLQISRSYIVQGEKESRSAQLGIYFHSLSPQIMLLCLQAM